MATHSSVLAWRIPGTGSLVGCRLWGRTESDTAKGTQQQQDVVYVNIFLFFLSLSLPFLLVSWKKGGYVVCLPLCLHLNSFLEKLWH